MLLSPFTFIYTFIYFFLSNFGNFHSEPREFISYSWTLMAKWLFREYNEVNHVFKQRISLSTISAIRFTNEFSNPINITITKFIVFLLTAIISIAITLSFINESILYVDFLNRNLLWYIAIFTGIVTVLKPNIREKYFKSTPQKYLEEINTYIRYKKDKWTANNVLNVYKEISAMLKYKTTIFFIEIFGVFFNPFFIIFFIRPQSNKICQFIRDSIIKDEKLGNICKYSSFNDIDNNNDKLLASYNNFKSIYHDNENFNI